MGKIIIVDYDSEESQQLKKLLENREFQVIKVNSVFKLLEVTDLQQADVIFLSSTLLQKDSLNLAKIIVEKKLTESLIITSRNEKELKEAKEITDEVDGFIVAPYEGHNLALILKLVTKKQQQIKKLEKEIATLNDKLSQRIKIEQAKGMLMSRQGLTEEKAYQKMRRLSMENRCPIIDIAEMLILSH